MTTKPSMIVNTIPVLELIHRGLKTKDPRLIDAAESVLSGLILHLKHEQAAIPAELKPQLDLLTALH